MNVQEARAIAQNLNAAADRAEAEGRTEMLESDISAAFAIASSALAALQSAIESAGK